MNDTIQRLFGDLFHEDNNLNLLQMGCRTIVIFFITLIIIKISGMRSFGQKSAFDSIIVIMLGAVLSRAVIGANPFFSIVASGFVFGVIHRCIALLSVKSDSFGRMIKGSSKCLYDNGKLNRANLFFTGISQKDIMEEVHSQLNQDDLRNVQQIFMERTGQISIIKKEK